MLQFRFLTLFAMNVVLGTTLFLFVYGLYPHLVRPNFLIMVFCVFVPVSAISHFFISYLVAQQSYLVETESMVALFKYYLKATLAGIAFGIVVYLGARFMEGIFIFFSALLNSLRGSLSQVVLMLTFFIVTEIHSILWDLFACLKSIVLAGLFLSSWISFASTICIERSKKKILIGVIGVILSVFSFASFFSIIGSERTRLYFNTDLAVLRRIGY